MELLRWLGHFEGLLSIKKNKKEAKSAAVRDAEKIYSGWSKGSMASSKGLKVDRKEIQAEERNSSWQGRAGTGLVLLGRAAQNPIAGLGHKGRESSVHRHLKGGFGEGGLPRERKWVGPSKHSLLIRRNQAHGIKT